MTATTGFTCRELLELYAMVLLLTDGVDLALFKRLGLDCAALESRLARWESSVGTEGDDAVADAARLIVLSGHTGRRRIMALLFRGAMLDQLSTVEKSAQLRDLATAAARMPEWVFGQAGLTPETNRVLEPTATRGTTQATVRTAQDTVQSAHETAQAVQEIVPSAHGTARSAQRTPRPSQETGHSSADRMQAGDAARRRGRTGATRDRSEAPATPAPPGSAGSADLDYSFEFGDELPADADPDYAPCRDGP